MPATDCDVPFYPNTPDDTHCFQAALRMVLKYFMPEVDFSWQQLDEVTAKKKGLWTWPMAGLNWLSEQGFEVLSIEDFDYDAFIAKPEDYLIERNGADVANEQISRSDIPAEVANAKQFLKTANIRNRLPAIEEIAELLRDGYLLIINVNSRTLNNKPGYVGHFIVIKGRDEHGFIAHDPGSPARANRHIQFEPFLRAWAYPNESAKTLIAIRPYDRAI